MTNPQCTRREWRRFRSSGNFILRYCSMTTWPTAVVISAIFGVQRQHACWTNLCRPPSLDARRMDDIKRNSGEAGGNGGVTDIADGAQVEALATGDVMSEEFFKIRRLPPYVFAAVNAMKARARACGEDIIDFGMGNPDFPTPPHIVDKLTETVKDPRTHRYSGRAELRAFGALSRATTSGDLRFPSIRRPRWWLPSARRRTRQLASATSSPGDVILVPNPSYPIHQFGFIIAGAAVRNIPVCADGDFLAALERAVQHSVPKTALVLIIRTIRQPNWLPSTSTAKSSISVGTPASTSCRMYYAEIYFDGNPPPSILQIPGAKDICVEFTLTAKTHPCRVGDRLRLRECSADRSARARQIVPGLWRVHASAGGSHCGAERSAGLRARCANATSSGVTY